MTRVNDHDELTMGLLSTLLPVEALAYFYILDGTIFKVPTMLDIVASRMV